MYSTLLHVPAVKLAFEEMRTQHASAREICIQKSGNVYQRNREPHDASWKKKTFVQGRVRIILYVKLHHCVKRPETGRCVICMILQVKEKVTDLWGIKHLAPLYCTYLLQVNHDRRVTIWHVDDGRTGSSAHSTGILCYRLLLCRSWTGWPSAECDAPCSPPEAANVHPGPVQTHSVVPRKLKPWVQASSCRAITPEYEVSARLQGGILPVVTPSSLLGEMMDHSITASIQHTMLNVQYGKILDNCLGPGRIQKQGFTQKLHKFFCPY